MTIAHVIVSGTPSGASDEEIPGTYLVEVSADAPRELIEETALETFHTHIGIEELDDFDISVVDQDGRPFPDQTVGSDIREKHPLESWGTFGGSIQTGSSPTP